MNHFSFKFQNVKVAWFVIGGFLVGMLSIILALLFNIQSPVVIIILLFGPMVAGIWIALKKGKATDTLTLDSKGFDSTYYGRVEYSDIKTVTGPTFWVQTPLALIMHLHSGRKLIWALSEKASMYNSLEDALCFNQFTDALMARLDQHYGFPGAGAAVMGETPLTITDDTEPSAPDGKTPYAKEATGNSTGYSTGIYSNQIYKKATGPSSPDLSGKFPSKTPNQPVKPRFTARKAAKTSIPFASIIVLLLALKNCGTNYIKEKKNREVREIFQYAEQNYNDAVSKAQATLDSVQRFSGSIFVYTNDSSASIKLTADIHSAEADILSDVPVLAHGAMTDSLRRFAEHPDSFRYTLLLKTGSGQTLNVGKSVLNTSDSASSWLYLSCFDPDLRVTEDGQVVNDSLGLHTEGEPFTFATGIPVYKNKSLLESMEGATLNLRMLLARTKFNQHYKIYLMAVSKMDQIPESLFKEAITVFNQQLHEVKADTTAFHFSIR